MSSTLAERKARLLAVIAPLFANHFAAGDLLNACAGLALKQPGHAELDAALKALIIGKRNRFLVGKLLADMRGEIYGKYRLDGELDAHVKRWRYKIQPASAPRPEEAAAQELADLEQAPVVTHADLDRIIAKPGLVDAILSKAERKRAKQIAKAKRSVVETNPERSAELKAIRTARSLQILQAALDRRAERERTSDAELPDTLTAEESEFATASGKYEPVYDSGLGTTQSFRHWRKKRVSVTSSNLNPYMTAELERELDNRWPPGHQEERERWVADPNQPGKLVKERYVHYVPYSGLAAADALCTETVRQAGGSGVPGFIGAPTRTRGSHPWGHWHPFQKDEDNGSF